LWPAAETTKAGLGHGGSIRFVEASGARVTRVSGRPQRGHSLRNGPASSMGSGTCWRRGCPCAGRAGTGLECGRPKDARGPGGHGSRRAGRDAAATSSGHSADRVGREPRGPITPDKPRDSRRCRRPSAAVLNSTPPRPPVQPWVSMKAGRSRDPPSRSCRRRPRDEDGPGPRQPAAIWSPFSATGHASGTPASVIPAVDENRCPSKCLGTLGQVAAAVQVESPARRPRLRQR